MTNKKFMAIWAPIIAVLLVIAIAGTAAANFFAETIDYHLGGGTVSVVESGDISSGLKDYYGASSVSAADATARAEQLSRQVSDEGTILLKNDGVLPLAAGAAVTPFGYGYLNPIHTGLGAGASSSEKTVSAEAAMKAYFTVNEAAVEKMRQSTASSPSEAPGTTKVRGDSGTMLSTNEEIPEYDASIYAGIANQVKDSVGVVFITRIGQEGADKKYDGYDDGTPHYYALTAKEKDTIRFAKENCRAVVVVLVTSNVMEIGELMEGELEVNAILTPGNPGPFGLESAAKIMVGEVVPSAKTVDIWAADFTKDPTYQNFGEFSYSNAQWGGKPRYFVDYAEGVYVGYRYYETAAAEDPDFDYDREVVYPFGHGLSYVDLDGGFTQEIVGLDDSGDTVKLTVKVTNHSAAYSGKDVVQVYYNPPYTDFDRENKIEKPVKNLVEFAKTDVLAPGASQEVAIEFAKEDMASYCYTRENPDGTRGAYVLEEGDYTLCVGGNSHESFDERTVNIPSTVWYDSANPRASERDTQAKNLAEGAGPIAASNQFQDASDYMQGVTMLSRADWKGTFPVQYAGRQKELLEAFMAGNAATAAFDYNTDAELGNVPGSRVYSEEMPASAVKNGLTVADMRGKDFNDPLWDDLLDQLDWDNSKAQIRTYLGKAAYSLGKLEDVGKTASITLSDGATGITSVPNYTSFAASPVFAATWNKELMQEFGEAIGLEALTGGVYGWYSPGLNIHRSPFSGRNYEYFSEDAVLTGKMAARIVSGAAEYGVFSFIKHFAVNDEETNRSNRLAAWATEQAIRENYLKAFELAIKESSFTLRYLEKGEDGQWIQREREMTAGLALMLSQACIGTETAMTHYGLITGVLRNEWGFNGIVSTDLYYGDDWIGDKLIRAGGDIFLGNTLVKDYDSATSRNLMRESIKRTLWVTANSGYMQGTVPGDRVVQSTAPWRIALMAADIAIGVFCAAMVGIMIFRIVDAKKHPEKYQGKKKK